MKSTPSSTSEVNIQPGLDWFEANDWKPFPFQLEAWEKYLMGYSGLINAPTGFGKTYSLIMPILIEAYLRKQKSGKGFRAIWIAPIRALTREIQASAQRAIEGLDLDWNVEVRTGDTTSTQRKKQITNPPEILITTPESVHILMASKKYTRLFKNLNAIVVDEWHELMGSKRGVQVELAISRLLGIQPDLRVWGISATIANIDQSLDILLGYHEQFDKRTIIRSNIKKHISVETILPDEIEKYPWAGHMGLDLLHKVMPIIEKSQSTILFTNTRAQSEIWYHRLLEVNPDLSGNLAMHHGSISRELRDWVEDALHDGRIKAVVSTSSLDLGVDFRPVDSIVQIGSPKGVSRFVQRAGRSGHRPLAVSKIYFVPTHSLELIEGSALRTAIDRNIQEPRVPYIRSYDVLIQYLLTLAVSDGFLPELIYKEVKKTFCYESMTREEWEWILSFIVSGGSSLQAYDEYQKVEIIDGLYKITNRKIATMHRLSIGTIVSEAAINVAFVSGKRLGTIEEFFAASLSVGDAFWFAGQTLEYVRIKDMTLQVKRSKAKKAKVHSWMGGRMPLSSMLSQMIREKMFNFKNDRIEDIETEALAPLLRRQAEQSHLPSEDEFLIEYIVSKDGYHLIFYPFEGRSVHEGMGALLGQRILEKYQITFSIGMNDYGFELLSDQPIDLSIINHELFSTKKLVDDIQSSMNSIEMARRNFRNIAKISGLLFQGYPGKHKKERHLQSSSSLLFDVFHSYDPDNLLYLQTYDEMMTFQLEESRLRKALERIQSQKLVVKTPEHFTPFSFPIIVDQLREKMSSERLKDRVKRMIAQAQKGLE